MPTKEKTVSIRLVPADFEKLEAQARRRFSKPATVGSFMVSQRLRAASHPAIDFQDTPDGGFCARIAGRRVSVWLAVDALTRCAGNKRKAARSLNLPEPLLVAALNYAAEYPDEIAADARRGRRTLKECGLEEAPP